LTIGHVQVINNFITEVNEGAKKAAPQPQKPLTEWNLPTELPYFVKRPLLHEQIQTHFNDKKTSSILALTALSGLGGIGKTQLANHYIHLAQYRFKAWFKADSKEALQQEYWSLAKELKLVEDKDTHEQMITRLHQWFEENPDWLLVYDNVKNKEDIYNLLPEKGGHLLITSRSGNSWHPQEQIEVSAMKLEEARALVKSLCAEEGKVVDALLAKLDYLPLAITHAASYMKKKGVSAPDYLELYEAEKLVLIDEGKLPPEDKHQPLMVTWRINKASLAQENPRALEILEYCALLNPHHIPTYLLISLLVDGKPAVVAKKAWGNIKENLLNYSLITLTVDNEMVSVHPLLQEFIRNEISEENLVPYLHSMGSILDEVSQELASSMQDIYRRQQLIPHLLAIVEVIDDCLRRELKDKALLELLKARLLEQAGMINQLVGNTHAAKELWGRTFVIKEHHYGKEHVEVALTLVNLANAYGDLGDVRQKKTLLEKALAIFEAHYGKEHVGVAITLVNLANAYGDLGDVRQKKALLEKALAIFEAHYGKEHVDVARILVNLAAAYGDLGDARQQKALLEKALTIQEAYYGKEHVEVARTLVNLATAYGALGDVQQKKTLLEKALAIQEAHLGKEHVEVVRTLGNLANAYGDLGDVRQKKTLLEKALTIFEAHYGKEHVDVARTLGNLATVYGDLGDVRQQKALLEKALAIFEVHYGKEHVDVARTLGDLATAHSALGDVRQVKALLEKALAIKEAHYGQSHLETAVTLYNLGVAYRQENNLDKAKMLIEQALAIVINYPGYGEQHPDAQQMKKTLDAIHQQLKLFSPSTSQTLPFTLDDMIKKYKLPNTQQVNIEEGLRSAIANQFFEDAKLFIQHVQNINAQDTDPISRKTALHWAVLKQQRECVQALLEAGADPLLSDAQGMSAIQFAKKNSYADIIDLFQVPLLKKYGLNDNSQLSLEKGLRIAVVSQGVAGTDLKDIALFIQFIDNINAKDTTPNSGKTALHYAVRKNNPKRIKLLLEAGANPKIPDAQGLTAVCYAEQSDNAEIHQLIQEHLSKQPADLTTEESKDFYKELDTSPSIILQSSIKTVTASNEAEKMARLNQTISTIEGICFNRYPVAGDGDCGYTAFGITRKQAFEVVRNGLPEVVEILKPVIQEQLLMQDFIDYLKQHQQASTALVQAFTHYQTAAQQGGHINDDIMQPLQRHASDLVIINGYIDYDIHDKRIDAGWPHPCVLQTLAHLQKIELYMWQKNSEGQLVPHEYYPHYRSPHLSSAAQRTDLLFMNGNHFERLELLSTEDSLQDVNASGSSTSAPMVLNPYRFNSATDTGQTELGIGLQPMKNNIHPMEKHMHEEHYKLRVERMQYFIQEAFAAYQFIGEINNDEHRAFQEKLKSFLLIVQGDMQSFAKRLNIKGSKLLGSSYDATWSSYQEKAKTIAKNLQATASKLSQPLDGTQQQLFEKILTKIEKKYAQEVVALKASDIRRILMRKLLEDELNTLARTINQQPTCFISYSWGPWGRVDAEHTSRVHRLAAHLKASGLKVVVDIWDNQVGDIHVFTGKLFAVDKVLVMGSPHLVEKYKNYSSSGESRGMPENYRGNVVAKEITYILQRIGNRPPNNHGVVLGLIEGTHESSFPKELQFLPSSDTDFAGSATISMDYIIKLFNLLKRLFSEQHHAVLEASSSKLEGLVEQLVSEGDKQRLWDIYEKIYQQKDKVKWDDVLLQSDLDEKRDVDIPSEKSPTGYEEGFVDNYFYVKSQSPKKQKASSSLLSGNYHGTNSSVKVGNIDIDATTVLSSTVLSDNHYGPSSSLTTGNIRIQSDVRESIDKVVLLSPTTTQSTFLSSHQPPATLPQKKMLKEVKDLLDKEYPGTDANEDDEIRAHREAVLAILNRLQGHKLNQQEEAELKQLLNSLRGEESSVDKKDGNRMDASLS